MKEEYELKLRKAIWKELKRFIKVGLRIEFTDIKPDIFYSSQELSLTLEKIMSLVRTHPLPSDKPSVADSVRSGERQK